MTRPVASLAVWLRCTEGQAYTLVIGLVLATLLAIGGVPATLRSHPRAVSPPAPAAPAPPPLRGAHR